MPTYFVNAAGSSTPPYDTKLRGAVNFKTLFDNVTLVDDVIEVVDDGTINEPVNPGWIDKKIIIRSWSGNVNKPLILIGNNEHLFVFDLGGGVADDIEVQNLRMYRDGPSSTGDFIVFTNGTYNFPKVLDCEMWVSDSTATTSDGITVATIVTGCEIKRNKIYDIQDAIYIGGSADSDIDIENNVIRACSRGIILGGATKDDINIVNNSMFNISDKAIEISTGAYTNSIIVNNNIHGNGNTNVGLDIMNFNSGTLDYNNVYDCITAYSITGSISVGGNSIAVDPLFVSATDLKLKGGSPCLDSGAGSGTYAEVPSDDYRGESRPQDLPAYTNADDGTDMGAYEGLQTEYSVSLLDVGSAVDISGGNVSVVSTINPNVLELFTSVIGDTNFSSSSKWLEVIVIYEHNSGQNKKIVHKLRGVDWIGYENFPIFCNGGDWRKNKIILIDSANDMLVIERSEIGTDEDLIMFNGSDSSESSSSNSSESSESSISSESSESSMLSVSSTSSESSESSSEPTG